MAKEYLTESSRWCRHLSGGTTKAFATVLVCLGLIPSTVVGQQNLFNVPSSDITEPGEIFYQQQINLLPDLLQFNSTMCYGLGRNFEIGFNIIGLNVNTQSSSPLIISNGDIHSPPVYPFYTLNLQKAFVLNRTLRVAVGAQTGLSIDAHFGNYTYTNLITSIRGIPRLSREFTAAPTVSWDRVIAICSFRMPTLVFNLASSNPSSVKNYM